jgi:Flp pilus assembly protein TadG
MTAGSSGQPAECAVQVIRLVTPGNASVRLVRGLPRRRSSSRGQSLVEFALVFPIFLTMVMGLFEFAFVFNALLSIGHASRDAALVAAEAGNDGAADCSILKQIENDVSAPADASRIVEVRIYRADQNGAVLNGQENIYTRTGSTSCTLPDNNVLTVPYTASSISYPPSDRCNVLLGTNGGCDAGHVSVDTIGVKITYTHSWVTPLANLVALGGTGTTLVQSNAMRMEPVL